MNVKIVSNQVMQETDRRAQEDYGIPGLILMENAGIKLWQFARTFLSTSSESRLVVLAGRGNNGGDGFVIARYLLQKGIPVSV